MSDVFKNNSEEQKIIIKKRNRTTLKYDRNVPDIEWWDKQLLGNVESY